MSGRSCKREKKLANLACFVLRARPALFDRLALPTLSAVPSLLAFACLACFALLACLACIACVSCTAWPAVPTLAGLLGVLAWPACLPGQLPTIWRPKRSPNIALLISPNSSLPQARIQNFFQFLLYSEPSPLNCRCLSTGAR